MLRDFKKNAGMGVDRWLDALRDLERALEQGEPGSAGRIPLHRLAEYYVHMQDLARGYEKDREKLAENLRHIQRWQDEVEELIRMLRPSLELSGENG
jgi:hypothetical protein